MKTLAYKRHWFRRGSFRPPIMVYSYRNMDQLIDGVILEGTEFSIYSSGRYRRKKV